MGSAFVKNPVLQPDKKHSAMRRNWPSNPYREVGYGGARRGVIIGFDRCNFGNTSSQFAREFSGNSHVLFHNCSLGQEGVSFKCKTCKQHLAWTRDIENITSDKAKCVQECYFPGYNGNAELQTFESWIELEDEEEQEEEVFNPHNKPPRSQHKTENDFSGKSKQLKRSKENSACEDAAGFKKHQTEVCSTQFQSQQSAQVQGTSELIGIGVQGACASHQSSVPRATTDSGNCYMNTDERSYFQEQKRTHESPCQTTRSKNNSRGGRNLRKAPGEDIVLVIVHGANVRAKPIKGKHPAQTWYEATIEKAVCLTCMNHIGWVFNSEDRSFFGLLMKQMDPPGN
ncbi:uncharacterized protein [Littorina saxatilis]|uniref:Yippee domain-containing protein n=1 Tax=Littorina saxatilis TaxID=31220 RepID=A0AAN9BHJ6_9CAEN